LKKDFEVREGLPPVGKKELDCLPNHINSERLLQDVRSLVERARLHVAQSVNSELVLLYWHIGRRIGEELPAEGKAEYGARVVELVSDRLTAKYGRGFRRSNVFHMIRFAEVFDDAKIVQTLSALLSWSHFIEIIYFKDPLQRQFYAEMARVERWSVRTLRQKIQGMLYERTAISRKPEELARQELEALQEEDRMTPDLVFRDPYLLDFLGLEDTYSERDLEAAILRELERFLLELGTDFSFIARQQRMTIGNKDFYLDLLFYHRSLRRLVAIELKLGSFDAAYKGQMELYLRWLDRYERRHGEEPPIGLILCSEMDREQIELLQLDRGEVTSSPPLKGQGFLFHRFSALISLQALPLSPRVTMFKLALMSLSICKPQLGQRWTLSASVFGTIIPHWEHF
jgi:predicted nuclease of restriction endonuclease-like (RecB) superfamily